MSTSADNFRFSRQFVPFPVLSNRHFQTIIARALPEKTSKRSSHHLIKLPDGDQLAVSLTTPPTNRPLNRYVVLIHGLCGCSQSAYMVRLANRLSQSGNCVVRVNLRGCGLGAGLARLPYHSGQSEDVRTILRWLALRSSHPVTVVGMSLGGNIALKLAGEDGAKPTERLDSVVAISAPIELDICCRMIELPSNSMYQKYFTRQLVTDIEERRRFFPELKGIEVPLDATIRLIDDQFTAPLSGFKNATDYYAQCSSRQFTCDIAVPSLVITSRDDPFIAIAPYESMTRPQDMTLTITNHGGHLGFLGNPRCSWFRWMDGAIDEWINQRSQRSGS